jgi:hypothetical protein
MVSEDASVASRPDYEATVRAWQTASSIVLIGYAFGSGADMLSFVDFGRNVGPSTNARIASSLREDGLHDRQTTGMSHQRIFGFYVVAPDQR